MLFVLSQILYVGSVLLYTTSMLQKKKILLTLCLMGADFCFSMHFLCLEKHSAMIFVVNEMILLFVLYFLQKYYNNDQTITTIACVFTIIMDIVAFIFTFSEWVVLISLFQCISLLVGLCFRNLIIVKSCAVVQVVLAVIYLFIIGSTLAGIIEIGLALSTILGLFVTIKDYKTKKIIKNFRESHKTILKSDDITKIATKKEEQKFNVKKHKVL
ncbi:MAG: YgjV family protein [Clostridia bacterium]|nr:YgjV family protein [Clostridia bacterium]